MNKDPIPIPNWLDDPEEVAPCPCGNPLDETCVLVESDIPLRRWLHLCCLGFLENEMDEEEIEEKREWEQQMRKLQKDENE